MGVQLLRLDEAAARLAVSRRQVDRLVAAGRLRAVRASEHATWRIPEDALEQFVAAMETNEPAYRSPKLRAVGS